MAISINIQCLTFSFDLYSETKTSYAIGAGSGLLDPPTSPPSTSASGATWSPRCTALALPPSTSCRLTSLGRWLSLTRQWWGEPCLTWVQGQPSASQQGEAALRSRPVIIHFLSEKFAVDSLHMYPLHFTHWSRKLDICCQKATLSGFIKKSYCISHPQELYLPWLFSTKLSFFWDTLYYII